MRRLINIFLLLTMIAILTSGCGTKAGSTEDNNNTKEDVFQAEVMESNGTLLVAPDPESNEYKASDKMSVNISDCVIMDNNDNEITDQDLKAGDILRITYNGTVMESYPAQITADAVQLIDHNTLIDGYLAIIDDIWQQDDGLNSDINTMGVDASNWIELTDIEKEIIFTELKNKYDMEIVEGTSEELAKQGLIDKDNLFFTKGVLITIDNMSYDKDNKKFTYSISKWRSGDGAIGSSNSTATYNGTKWEIKNEGCWIS